MVSLVPVTEAYCYNSYRYIYMITARMCYLTLSPTKEHARFSIRTSIGRRRFDRMSWMWHAIPSTTYSSGTPKMNISKRATGVQDQCGGGGGGECTRIEVWLSRDTIPWTGLTSWSVLKRIRH